jgi:hypothetical protein
VSSFVSDFLFDSNRLFRIIASLEKSDALLWWKALCWIKLVALRSLKAPAFVIIEVSAIVMSN